MTASIRSNSLDCHFPVMFDEESVSMLMTIPRPVASRSISGTIIPGFSQLWDFACGGAFELLTWLHWDANDRASERLKKDRSNSSVSPSRSSKLCRESVSHLPPTIIWMRRRDEQLNTTNGFNILCCVSSPVDGNAFEHVFIPSLYSVELQDHCVVRHNSVSVRLIIMVPEWLGFDRTKLAHQQTCGVGDPLKAHSRVAVHCS